MSDLFLSAAYEGSSVIGDSADVAEDEDIDDPESQDQDEDDDLDDEEEEESEEEEMLVECPFCTDTMQQEALAPHVSQHHRLGCLRCRRLLASEDELEMHLQQHEDSFTCNLCEQQFDDEADYEFHRMSTHDAVKCPKCTQVLLEHEYAIHSKTCHNRKQVLRPLRDGDFGPQVVVVRPGRQKRRKRVMKTTPEKIQRFAPPKNKLEEMRRQSKGAKERSRRAELGNAFDSLRTLVPTTSDDNSAATKQAILREAVQHIKVLEEQSHTYHKMRLLLKRQQQRMNERIKALNSE